MNLANLKEKNGFSSWSHLVKFDHATSQTDYFKKMSNLKWNKFCKDSFESNDLAHHRRAISWGSLNMRHP